MDQLWHPLLTENSNFSAWQQSHWAVLLLMVLITTVALRCAVACNNHTKLILGRAIALALAMTVIVWTALQWHTGQFNAKTDLPLMPCNLLALLAPLLLWWPNQARFNVYFFIVMAGTFQSFITPDLQQAFPHYTFFKYWLVHGGLVVLTLYLLLAFRLYPAPRHIWHAFLYFNLYIAAMAVINFLFGTNLIYLAAKPEAPTVLNVLGPWPWYLLVAELLIIPAFALVYAPIYPFYRRQQQQLSAAAG